MEDELMEQVMNNPMLLQRILEQVKVEETSIKGLRLVSKTWNDLILSLPEPRICFIVNNLRVPNSWDPQVFINHCLTMNPKLARCIGLVSRATLNSNPIIPAASNHGLPDHANGYRMESVGYLNLKYCIANFSTQIHTLDLLKAYVKIDYVQVIHQLLQSFCPNLSRILLDADSLLESRDRRQRPLDVSQTWRDIDFSSLLTATGGLIPRKLKLKTIRFELFECQGPSPRAISGPFHNLYQALITSAQNLVGLRQDFIAFPDCRRLKNLSSLNFKIQLHRSDFNTVSGDLEVPFNLTGLNRMLRQLSNALKYLKLEINHLYCSRPHNRDCICRERLGFRMPQMMNLDVFRCSDFDILFGNELGGNVQLIRNVNRAGVGHEADSLRCIEIGRNTNGHVPGISASITDICNMSINHPVARSVTTVVVNGISVLAPLQNLRGPFPAISNLVINKHFKSRNVPDPNGRYEETCQLAQALNVCYYITLTAMNCHLPYPSLFTTFVNVLYDNIPHFRQGFLRQLTLVGTGTPMNMNSVQDSTMVQRLEQVFMSMRDMDFVEFVNCSGSFPMDVASRLITFIIDNDLPVYFLKK